jgi:hypothetical protein
MTKEMPVPPTESRLHTQFEIRISLFMGYVGFGHSSFFCPMLLERFSNGFSVFRSPLPVYREREKSKGHSTILRNAVKSAGVFPVSLRIVK